MKKLILVSAIAISGLMYQTANAQIGVHFNVNLGARPVVVERAPVYYNDADYYYLPELGAYYSVNQQCYYYQDGGSWISAAYLPGRYHDYDWQHASHYAVNEPLPYLHNDVYRARYGGFDGRHDWNYRDERSTRVYADRDRFDHDQYKYRSNDYNRGYQRNDYNRGDQRSDAHERYDNRNDHQQQHDNRGGDGGRNDHGSYQQPQQQNNNDRGNHGNDNRGSQNNWQGRSGRF